MTTSPSVFQQRVRLETADLRISRMQYQQATRRAATSRRREEPREGDDRAQRLRD